MKNRSTEIDKMNFHVSITQLQQLSAHANCSCYLLLHKNLPSTLSGIKQPFYYIPWVVGARNLGRAILPFIAPTEVPQLVDLLVQRAQDSFTPMFVGFIGMAGRLR